MGPRRKDININHVDQLWNVKAVWPRSGSANSFTLTSGAILISVLVPGVIKMNCRPMERRAAVILQKKVSKRD
jgi:hypothetical protein